MAEAETVDIQDLINDTGGGENDDAINSILASLSANGDTEFDLEDNAEYYPDTSAFVSSLLSEAGSEEDSAAQLSEVSLASPKAVTSSLTENDAEAVSGDSSEILTETKREVALPEAQRVEKAVPAWKQKPSEAITDEDFMRMQTEMLNLRQKHYEATAYQANQAKEIARHIANNEGLRKDNITLASALREMKVTLDLVRKRSQGLLGNKTDGAIIKIRDENKQLQGAVAGQNKQIEELKEQLEAAHKEKQTLANAFIALENDNRNLAMQVAAGGDESKINLNKNKISASSEQSESAVESASETTAIVSTEASQDVKEDSSQSQSQTIESTENVNNEQQQTSVATTANPMVSGYVQDKLVSAISRKDEIIIDLQGDLHRVISKLANKEHELEALHEKMNKLMKTSEIYRTLKVRESHIQIYQKRLRDQKMVLDKQHVKISQLNQQLAKATGQPIPQAASPVATRSRTASVPTGRPVNAQSPPQTRPNRTSSFSQSLSNSVSNFLR